MTLEEQIELFTQKLVTKNNLPHWFIRTLKDLISKNVTIEEWNTFTQYISNNASDIKSIEEFVLVLAEYIEGYCSKDYVDSQDAATLANAKSYADNKFETKADAFSGNYNDLTNKPNLFSGNYNDLTNKPTIPTVPTNVSAFYNDAGYLTSVTWSQVSGKPNFATVATTGNYADLINTPDLSFYNEDQDKINVSILNVTEEAYFDSDVNIMNGHSLDVDGDVTASSFTGTHYDSNNNELKVLYKHDILLNIGYSGTAHGTAHLIIIDDNPEQYTLANINFSGNLYPVSYTRKEGSSTLTSYGSRFYLHFYSRLSFEEEEDFWNGSSLDSESINTYDILGVGDIVFPL